MSDKLFKVSETKYFLVWGKFTIENTEGKTLFEPNKTKRLFPLYSDITYKDFIGYEYIEEYVLNYSLTGKYDLNNLGIKLTLTNWPLKKEKSIVKKLEMW